MLPGAVGAKAPHSAESGPSIVSLGLDQILSSQRREITKQWETNSLSLLSMCPLSSAPMKGCLPGQQLHPGRHDGQSLKWKQMQKATLSSLWLVLVSNQGQG